MIKDDLLLSKIQNLDRKQIESLIDDHITGRNSERNRKILKRRLLDGVYYEPLSEEFELSIRQTQNIVYDGIQKLLSVII